METNDLDKPVGREAQKLMFMLAAAAVGAFSELTEQHQIDLAAIFGISAPEMLIASRDFAQIVGAFTDQQKRAVEAWRRAQH